MSNGIIAIVEHAEGSLKKIAGEVCSEAVRLGQSGGASVCAVAVGPDRQRALAALQRPEPHQPRQLDGLGLARFLGDDARQESDEYEQQRAKTVTHGRSLSR